MDEFTRASATYRNAQRLGAHSGQAWGSFESHRIMQQPRSLEWRSYAKGALYLLPWIIGAALVFGFVHHGFIDHTRYLTASVSGVR